MPAAPHAMLARLRAALAARDGVVVGFSGGVDSALLAAVAHDALGDRTLAVTVDSPSFARRELEGARAFAQALGLRWEVAQAAELSNPLYVANNPDRCFFCRDEMSAVLRRVADREGIATLAMGVNRSDLGEWRPGHEAMKRAGVWFPLLDVGAAKEDVRAMARSLGLAVAEKPAMACLSSRIPHGQPVEEATLRRVEAAEDWLRDRGFAQVRVRALGRDARIEVLPLDVPRLRRMEGEAAAELQRLGFAEVRVDPLGYRAGALTEHLVQGP